MLEWALTHCDYLLIKKEDEVTEERPCEDGEEVAAHKLKREAQKEPTLDLDP